MSTTDIFDLSNCTLCPRNCGINRLKGQLGFCGIDGTLRAARAALLYYEEPCISGSQGSGAVFFTGCNLGCVFCQNISISHGLRAKDDSSDPQAHSISSEKEPAPGMCHGYAVSANAGRPITPDRLCDIFFELEQKGAANINLVTASHVLPLVIPAIRQAKNKGLSIPFVYNTASYEKAEAIHALDGLIDIYLPDLKYCSAEIAGQYSTAPDYWETATAAIAEMVRQCPEPLFADGSSELDEEDDRDDPLMRRGVIVRHMVMPGHTDDSRKVIRYLHETYGNQIFLSIMNQYTPMPQCSHDPLLSRPVTEEEYNSVVDYAISLGVENGFLQEGGTISKSFIPAWDGTGI